MRKIRIGFIIFAVICCCFGCSKKEEENFVGLEEVRAMWISYIDLASMIERDAASTILNLEAMIENCKRLNINTLYVHASAFTDAYYQSEYYPWAKNISGKLGQEGSIDPLEKICTLAKSEGIRVEAWINPLRSFLKEDMIELEDQYLIKQWVNHQETRNKWVVEVNGRYYLNPYYEECRNLIVNVVRELVDNYDISGIHMDDYFYPEGIDASFDASAYQDFLNKGGNLNLSDFRRENVNRLVKEIYDVIKEKDEKLLFGISPAGNISYSVDTIFGDVREWIQNPGYIDYIVPQIYFGYQHQTLDFETCLGQWKDLTKGTNVKLVIGLAAYKQNQEDFYAGSGKEEWITDQDVLVKQISQVLDDKSCVGFSLYSYSFIFDGEQGENPFYHAQIEKIRTLSE